GAATRIIVSPQSKCGVIAAGTGCRSTREPIGVRVAQRRQRASWQQERAHRPQLREDAIARRLIEVFDARRAAGADAAADRALDHARVPGAPEDELFFQLDDRVDEKAWPGEQRQLAVGLDEEQPGADTLVALAPFGCGVFGEEEGARLPQRLRHATANESRIAALNRHDSLDLLAVQAFHGAHVILQEAVAGAAVAGVARGRALNRRAVQPFVQRSAQRLFAPGVVDALERAASARARRRRRAQRLHRRDGVGDAVRLFEPEQDLDLAHLEGLEPARRRQLVAKIEEVLRRQRLHDAELLDG